MSSIPVPDYPFLPPKEDARDLLARLYREIGIAAVAAALEIPTQEPVKTIATLEEQISAAVRGQDLAA
jgi:hypothetical protein